MKKVQTNGAEERKCFIMSSDEDQPIVQELSVEFNLNKELIVSIVHVDYEDDRYNCSTWALVNQNETQELAGRLKIPCDELPRFIGERMSEWREVVNPALSQVQDCFKEITEYLLDEGCRFQIKRTFGLHGFMCC